LPCSANSEVTIAYHSEVWQLLTGTQKHQFIVALCQEEQHQKELFLKS
jgi:hypothetical protein